MIALLISIIYLTFISLGLPDSMLGASWPTIYAEMDVPISYMGILSLIISGSTIISSLLTDRVVARLGTVWVAAISVVMTALSLFGISLSSEFYQLCLMGIPYGLGAGAIDAAMNNYVALHFASRHMSWLHCFWGVGTIISPYIMTAALTHASWNAGYMTVGAIQLLIAAAIALSFPLWRMNSAKKEEISVTPIGIRGAVRIRGVLPVLLGFLSYCAAEATAMLWTSSYFEGVFSVTKNEAATLGSLFFIGMTIGRFLSGFITDRLGDMRMISIGTVVSAIGIALIIIPVKEVAIGGFILFGLGCAPIYPSIIHMTPLKFGKEKSQSIIGIQMASAYLGSTLAPPLFGIIAEEVSIGLMPLYLAVFIGLMIVMLSHQ